MSPPLQVFTVHMPRLSPCMTHGKVVRYEREPGMLVSRDDVFMEVETHELLEEGAQLFAKLARKNDQTAVGVECDRSGLQTHTLQVEAHDEGYLANVTVREGEEVPVDTILGYVVEDDPTSIDKWLIEEIEREIRTHNETVMRSPDPDSRAESGVTASGDLSTSIEFSSCLWQAYVKRDINVNVTQQ